MIPDQPAPETYLVVDVGGASIATVQVFRFFGQAATCVIIDDRLCVEPPQDPPLQFERFQPATEPPRSKGPKPRRRFPVRR